MEVRKAIRKIFSFVLLPIIMQVARLFYSKKYLKGRWFEQYNTGWRWSINGILYQKILGFNRNVKWPVTLLSKVIQPNNIEFHPDNLDNFQSPGCYFQASVDAKIILGRGTYIAPNVGLITSNHDPKNLDDKLPGQDIIIGENCWIGMNSTILPGVVLGDNTTVAAGAVVTKSYNQGNVVLAGVPAKIIKEI